MNEPASAAQTAAVESRNGEEPVLREYLRARGLEGARIYAPEQFDDVVAAIRNGSIRAVVFADATELGDCLWRDNIDPAAWLLPDVRVEFARPPGNADAVSRAIAGSWSRWNRARRRCQALAGLIVSAIALAAAWLINAAWPMRP
jgi:hypothetical protein